MQVGGNKEPVWIVASVKHNTCAPSFCGISCDSPPRGQRNGLTPQRPLLLSSAASARECALALAVNRFAGACRLRPHLRLLVDCRRSRSGCACRRHGKQCGRMAR